MSTTTPASTRPRGRHHRRRGVALVAAVALLVGVAAACEPDTAPPSWNVVDRAHATVLGPHVVLSWDAATGTPSRYRIDVGGVTATILQPAATSCVMVGLAAGTAHTFRITAYDAAGNWSDALPPSGQHDPGYRPTSATTPAGPGGGPALRCVPTTDTDGDRLPDALETNTGTYAHTAATGTSPTVPDTDVDGLRDGDEVLGTPTGLDLHALGTRPTGKDLLLEIDWAAAAPCVDMRPQASWIDPVVAAFAQVPLVSPGPDGINLIVDYGQGGVFTGGNPIPDDDGRIVGPGIPDPRPANFTANRVGYFHYGRIASQIPKGIGIWATGGLASLGGDGVLFGFGCAASLGGQTKSRLLMHELGHNLTLHHGGHEAADFKPGYGSIMNGRYLHTGADLDCDGVGDGPGVLAFSDELRDPIDENDIVETTGACGVPMDVDQDGSIDTSPYAVDVNYDDRRTVLAGSDDMARIDLTSFNDPNRSGRDQEIVDPLP